MENQGLGVLAPRRPQQISTRQPELGPRPPRGPSDGSGLSIFATRNAPVVGGLAHFARGETILPHQAMRADPSLRQHAVQSMARQGRNPSQYQMGGQNSRNPGSGLAEFADMIYTDQGWVVPNADGTYAPVDFSGAAATTPNFTGNSNRDPVTGALQVASFGGLPSIAGRQIGDVIAYEDQTPLQRTLFQGNEAPYGGSAYSAAARPPPPPGYGPGSSINNHGADLPPTASTAPPDTSTAADDFNTPPPGAPTTPSQTFDEWQNPGTYGAWRENRNPQGKGVQDQFYGQATPQGTTMGLEAFADPGPNVLGAQIPVPQQNWATPGTALGLGSPSGADQPSILNNGYSQGMGSFVGAMGPGWAVPGGGGGGNPNGGITGFNSSDARPKRNVAAAFDY